MTIPLLRIIFMGTPDFSVPALQSLIDDPSCEVIAVYTQPARPAGRGQQLKPSPIHKLAEDHHIPVHTPKSLKRDPDAIRIFQNLKPDIAVVAAYGLILPQAILDSPRYGCLNIHASLLPRWRGAAPIQRAIEAGDSESGITIMQMEEGLDTGPMILKESIPITSKTTAQTLHDDLSLMGARMITSVLQSIIKGQPLPQDLQDETLSCYAPMLKKEEGLIDWSETVRKIDLKIRAFTPWPGCYTFSQNRKRIKIISGEGKVGISPEIPGTILSADGDVSCGDGVYRVHMLQPENSKIMDFKSAVNGQKISIAEKWGV